AAGDPGKIYRTTNGGDNWALTQLSSNEYLYGINFMNQSTGFVCGNNGLILRTTNAGNTWDSLASGTTLTLTKVAVNSNGVILVSGIYGRIMKSTNLGANWTSVSGLTQYTINDVKFLDNNTAYAVGSGGELFITYNAGDSWIKDQSKSGNILRTLSIVSPSKIMVFGEEGNMLKFTPNLTSTGNGSINEVPSGFSLEQNFPNPFNPATVVKFSIPADADVKLVVFDITGREVKTLADGKMNAGRHELSFIGAMLSSGAYFYRLDVTGKDGISFTDTKKMILVK
ncbi:MAG TPA: YCF48-related protein, partial [Ignavibacteria bacterium]|nr:YCF48-related protein [Ignavibacteria bacterium]